MFLTIARLCELNMKRGGNEDRWQEHKKRHIIKAREINVSKIDFSRFLRF